MDDLMTRWIAALRSGKYKQGKNALRKTNGEDTFCCLGVLCDVYDPSGWAEPIGKEVPYKDNTTNSEMRTGVLPYQITTAIGMTAQGAFQRQNGSINSLIYLNDEGVSFNEIADLLESGEIKLLP